MARSSDDVPLAPTLLRAVGMAALDQAACGTIDLASCVDPTTRVRLPVVRARRWLRIGGALALLYGLVVLWVAVRSPDLGFSVSYARRVSAVWPDGVAAAAGVRRGDLIVAVDGSACSVRACLARLGALRPG